MNKANFNKDYGGATLITVPEAMNKYRMCRNSIMKYAEQENAIRRFGRSVRIDVAAMDEGIKNY